MREFNVNVYPVTCRNSTQELTRSGAWRAACSAARSTVTIVADIIDEMPPEESTCPGLDSISREIWYGLPATGDATQDQSVASIPLNTTADAQDELSIFEGEGDLTDPREWLQVRGFLCDEAALLPATRFVPSAWKAFY